MTDIDARRAPAALLPYQQRWCADNAKVKVIEKSRRVGLSWAEAADSALLAASEKGMNVWYISYAKDMAIEFINDCANWAKHYNHAAGEITEGEEVFTDGKEEKSILVYVIRFASGFRITALSSRPTGLRGKQGRAIVDEGAFLEDLAGMRKAALAFLMWGGQVHFISSHNGAENPFNDLVEEIRAGKWPYSLHRVTFDDAVREGLYRRICLKLGNQWTPEGEAAWIKEVRDSYGADAAEELDCIPKNGGGAYLSRALIESRMSKATPVLRWEQPDSFVFLPDHIRIAECLAWCEQVLLPELDKLPRELKHFIGEDFGRNNDLSVFWPLTELRNLVRRTPFIVELRNIPFKQQEQVFLYLCNALPRFTGGALDARGNGQYLAEAALQAFGSKIEMVMLSEQWYRENMPPLKAAFEDGDLIDLPSDTDVLNDIRAFQVIKGVARIPETRTSDAKGNKRHGDAGVALALAHYASRELNQGPITDEIVSGYTRQSVTILEGYV